MEKIAINEEMHMENEWFEQAKKQTLETLPEFVRHVMNDYVHDYGTICHAVGACAVAAAWAANEEPQGGITGFQASFVMWDFVKQWQFNNNKTGLRILDFDNLLYPQYGHKFEKKISTRTWEAIQKRAKELIDEKDEYVHQAVQAHWQSIVDGVVPHGFVVEDD